VSCYFQAGAEKLRCYIGDARTHKRCYLIEVCVGVCGMWDVGCGM
jgi:hypothetical protein